MPTYTFGQEPRFAAPQFNIELLNVRAGNWMFRLLTFLRQYL